MTKLTDRNGKLFVDDKEVIRGWESFSGWYWFAVEEAWQQTSVINGKQVKDIIYFGFVQGLEEEWGYFSLAELESLSPKVWEIPPKNLPFLGRRRQ